MDGTRTRTVLLVESKELDRDRMGSWLEAAGFDVLHCPGPTAPDYECVAQRSHACPLAKAADVVVLDLWLDPDREMRGTSSIELLAYYLGGGVPVVALVARADGNRNALRFIDRSVAWVDLPVDRHELVENVRALVSPAA